MFIAWTLKVPLTTRLSCWVAACFVEHSLPDFESCSIACSVAIQMFKIHCCKQLLKWASASISMQKILCCRRSSVETACELFLVWTCSHRPLSSKSRVTLTGLLLGKLPVRFSQRIDHIDNRWDEFRLLRISDAPKVGSSNSPSMLWLMLPSVAASWGRTRELAEFNGIVKWMHFSSQYTRKCFSCTRFLTEKERKHSSKI